MEAQGAAATRRPTRRRGALRLRACEAGLLLRFGLLGLLSVPFWHAPALVHWDAQGAAKSLFFSTIAVWRNKGAFIVYSLAWLGVFMLLRLVANLLLGAARRAAAGAARRDAGLDDLLDGVLRFAVLHFRRLLRAARPDVRRRPRARLIRPITPRRRDRMKVAMVTGAGSGIGRACALALLQAGYHVVLAGRRVDALEETRPPAGDTAANALAVPTDADQPAVGQGAVRRDRGRPSVASTCCSTTPAPARRRSRSRSSRSSSGRPSSTSTSTGVFLCTQQAFRLMKSQDPKGGRIINNGSISAHAPRPFSAPYTATKHAITGLTKATSLDGRAYDIACGQIDIGNAASEMTARMADGVPQADGRMMPEPRMDVAARRRRRPAHGQPAARRQRAVHDRHGHQDAVRRPRLTPRRIAERAASSPIAR